MLKSAKLTLAIGSLLVLGVSTAAVASAQGTPTLVNTVVSATQMAAATDPGLPATVGTVNGEVVTSRAMAESEYFFAQQSNEPMDTTAMRTEAWNFIVRQVVEEQTAKQTGLFPPISAVEQVATATGQSTTPQNLRLLQAVLAVMALKQHFWGSEGMKLNNTEAWDAYVNQLVQSSTIVLYAKF